MLFKLVQEEMVWAFNIGSQILTLIFTQQNNKQKNNIKVCLIMVEPLLCGIVLGLIPVTIAGLFVTAYLQYRRGDLATY